MTTKAGASRYQRPNAVREEMTVDICATPRMDKRVSATVPPAQDPAAPFGLLRESTPFLQAQI